MARESAMGWRETFDPQTRLAGSRSQLAGNIAESRVGVCTNVADSNKANDDDQSEHNSVFNSRRTIFRRQETHYFVEETLHGKNLQSDVTEATSAVNKTHFPSFQELKV